MKAVEEIKAEVRSSSKVASETTAYAAGVVATARDSAVSLA